MARLPGKQGRTWWMHSLMKALAPLESCTLPERLNTENTWPVWATVQYSG